MAQYYQQYLMKEGSQMSSKAQQKQTDRIYLNYKHAEVEGECILLQISPIKFVAWRYIIFLISNIAICIPYLLTFWYPRFKKTFYYEFCTLKEATDLYILNYDEQVSIVSKQWKVFMIDEEKSKFSAYFINRYMTYIIEENEVVTPSIYNYRNRISRIARSKQQEYGLSDSQAHQLKNSYGPGTMIIQRPSCVDLTIRQILRPLYIFLIFSVAFWTWGLKYFYFSGILFFTSVVGLVINLFQMIQLNKKIFSMAYYDIPVNVLREGKLQIRSSIDVVPGDIVFLKDPIKIPFEGVILEGSALINECALTGQSVPIVKKADSLERIENQQLSIDKSAFIYEGTTIVQVNHKKRMRKFQAYRQLYGIPICVVRTNFVTIKGQLIRIILFPKQQQNSFQRQSYKYLAFIFCFSVLTYVALVILIHQYSAVTELVMKFIILITISVPPALPVSMTFGIIYAVQKLEKKGIYCIAQNKVITGGMISLCCFDKTGTLTEDFMDFYAIVPANQANFLPIILNNQDNRETMFQDSKKQPIINRILNNMASNNSIIKIETTSELIGDPMEIKLFDFGGFELNQSHNDPNVIFGFESGRGHNGLVYRRFQFDSGLQRMSVICKNSMSKGCEVYTKGSPEIMTTIMQKQSIPYDYHHKLKEYTSHGFRVLSIASKDIHDGQLSSITREQTEKDLIFNGFQIFENKLKPETKSAITTLKNAQIKCVMITGDNALTGSNISYKCGISEIKKGMIICDYNDGHFIEDRFYFKEDVETTIDPKESNSYTEIMINTTITEQNLHIERDQTKDQKRQTASEANLNNFVDIISRKAIQTNSQLCLTGRAFNQLFPGPIASLSKSEQTFLSLISVFARTKPNDKAKIVLAFQHMDKNVAMCGDGANDCGALKQADIGLSLSQAEASISSPFTSQVANISSMVELIKQCRAGLATNFSLFNVLAIYTLIQYTTTVICQKYLQYPADWQYLYWDLCLSFSFIIFIGYTKTTTELSPDKPRNSLFGVTNILQMMVAFIIQVAGQISIIAIFQAYNSDYYWKYGGMQNAITNYSQTGGVFVTGLEANIIFVFVNNLYVISMIAFNISKPWRQNFFTNLPLMVLIMLTLLYNQIIHFWPAGSWSQFHSAAILPDYRIRWIIFGASWGFSLLILILQKLILEPLSNRLVREFPHHKWL